MRCTFQRGLQMAKQANKDGKRSDRLIGRRYRYTADYQIVPALGPGGTRSKRLIYRGEWILPVNDAAEYRRLVLSMRLLLALAVGAVIGALMVLPPPMENKWYVPVLVFSSFPIAFEIMGAVRLPASPRHMERQHFDKSFLRLGHSAMFAFVVMCAAALGLAIYWIVVSVRTVEGAQPYAAGDAVFAVLLAAAAAAEFQIYRLHKRIRTETLENSAHQA